MGESNRNPISVLNEYCQATKTACPDFQLVNQEGACHMRFFTISCKVLDKVATGTGRSKKDAKLGAADKMVAMLKEEGVLDGDDLQGKDQKAIDLLCNTFSEMRLEENPIGLLQEYCVAQKLPLPDYTNVPANSSGFVTVCKINSHSSTGYGSQKKTAKADAARKMCKLLMKDSHTGTNNEICVYQKDEVDLTANRSEEPVTLISVKTELKDTEDEIDEDENKNYKFQMNVNVDFKKM